MTKHNTGDEGVSFECDNCSTMLDIDDASDWGEVMRDLRDAGWVAYKEEGEWVHKCKQCKGRN